MEKTILKMEDIDDGWKNKAFFLMLKGKALNVTSSYSQQAEDALSKAVKLDPGLVEGWNQLGEAYWKKMDVASAKTCFSGALNHVRSTGDVESCLPATGEHNGRGGRDPWFSRSVQYTHSDRSNLGHTESVCH
ncbi:hypothetical protein FKM82_031046 [Ascaphus truei]